MTFRGWEVDSGFAGSLFTFNLMSLEVFDSLPYYDDDMQKYPYLKQKVEQELARELQSSETLHPRVPPAIELFTVRELLFAIIHECADINLG